MLVTTTPLIDGHSISRYLGVVSGENVIGINFVLDIGAGLRNIFGGRSAGYENEIVAARESTLSEMADRARAMGANAVIGVDIDYEAVGDGNMLMIIATGTAVVVDSLP